MVSVVSFDSLASKLSFGLTQVMLLITEEEMSMFSTTMARKDVRSCQIRIFQPMGRRSENGGNGKNEMRPKIAGKIEIFEYLRVGF